MVVSVCLCGLEDFVRTYIGCEHCGGDFATVFAVADVGIDKAFAFDRLSHISHHVRRGRYQFRQVMTYHLKLDRATIASCCCSLRHDWWMIWTDSI
jgi:hypothetical protein